MKVYHSSKKDDWETPPEFFAKVEALYGPFDVDICATDANSKCRVYRDEECDSLNTLWVGGTFWCNPPYSQASAWIKKAVEEVKAKRADRVVLLLAARTDTKVWHEYIFPYAKEIVFVKGRIRFLENGEPSKYSAPFPSAVVVFEAV